jgi:hypothetical protein
MYFYIAVILSIKLNFILYKPPSDEGGGPLAVEGENGNFVANGLDKP